MMESASGSAGNTAEQGIWALAEGPSVPSVSNEGEPLLALSFEAIPDPSDVTGNSLSADDLEAFYAGQVHDMMVGEPS